MKRLFLLAAAVVACCTFAAAQQYKVLYNFAGPPTDGQNAIGPLILDNAGNLYGETLGGGSGANGGGTVFEVSPGSNGAWTEQVPREVSISIRKAICMERLNSAVQTILASFSNCRRLLRRANLGRIPYSTIFARIL